MMTTICMFHTQFVLKRAAKDNSNIVQADGLGHMVINKDISFFLLAAPVDDHDDSDMWMEPDELPPPQYSVVRSESRVVRQYSTSPQYREQRGGFRPIHAPPSYSTISRSEHSAPAPIDSPSYEAQNPSTAEQNFFPSFFRNPPSSGHSRPFQVAQPNSAASIAGRYSAGRSQNFDQSILGSGDFSVLRGGTFFPEGSRSFRGKNEDFLSSLLNGHGRPNAQPLTATKKPYYPEDPFENFKDFADINAGNDPAFSHFIVVYANKNSTKPHPSHPSPKNIFEQLQLLDREKEQEKSDQENSVDESPKEKEFNEKKLMKLSKFKSKLAKTKVVKKYKKKLGPKVDTSPDYTDPLLALS